MRFSVLHTAHMFVTGADMLAEVVAVEGCWVDATLDAIQCVAHSTHVGGTSRHACRSGCCSMLLASCKVY